MRHSKQSAGVYCLGIAVRPRWVYLCILPKPGNRFVYKAVTCSRAGGPSPAATAGGCPAAVCPYQPHTLVLGGGTLLQPCSPPAAVTMHGALPGAEHRFVPPNLVPSPLLQALLLIPLLPCRSSLPCFGISMPAFSLCPSLLVTGIREDSWYFIIRCITSNKLIIILQ